MARLKPIHPGGILREEFMVPLQLNANKLALHVPAPSIYDIVKEQRGIARDGSSARMRIRNDCRFLG